MGLEHGPVWTGSATGCRLALRADLTLLGRKWVGSESQPTVLANRRQNVVYATAREEQIHAKVMLATAREGRFDARVMLATAREQ